MADPDKKADEASTPKEPLAAELAIDGASAIVRTAIALATDDPGSLLASNTALAVVTTATKRSFAARWRRLEGLWNGYRRPWEAVQEDPVEGLQQSVESSEKAQEVWLQAMRAMTDAIDPAVLPSVGALAGEYHRLDAKPDRRFRGLARVLTDLDEGELAILREILEQASSSTDDDGPACSCHAWIRLRWDGA